MLGSFHITTVRNVPIRVHFTTLILLLVMARNFQNPLVAVVYTFFILLSVALHELGHTVVSQRYGTKVQDILLTPIGGIARLQGLPENPRHEIRIALAGPYVSLLLFFLGAGLFILTLQLGLPPELPFAFAWINAMLFLFNLLPNFPMDGGRVLRATLTRKKGALESTRISAQVGKFMSITFMVVGFVSENISLMVVGAFILMSAGSEYRMMRMKHWQNQQMGGPGMDAAEADFQASPPPYATKQGPKVPDNLFGDILITFRDLFEEICASCSTRAR